MSARQVLLDVAADAAETLDGEGAIALAERLRDAATHFHESCGPDLSLLTAAEARGWRWRLGPSFCVEPRDAFYVGHLLRLAGPWGAASRVIPATGVTLDACVAAMGAAIAKEEAKAAAPAEVSGG